MKDLRLAVLKEKLKERRIEVRLQIEHNHVGRDRIDVDADHFDGGRAADKFDGESVVTLIGDMCDVGHQFRE